MHTNQKIRIISILFALFWFVSCNMQTEIETQSAIRFLALGDSYTIGQGIDVNQSWPNQLSNKLVSKEFSIQETKIIARTGWRTSDLLNALPSISTGEYNLVSLLIGVNNQYTNQPFSIFNTEFTTLLNEAVNLAGGKERVFVLSIPDYGVTPFGSSNSATIAMELDNYNDYIEAKCLQLDILYFNITEISRTLGDAEGALAADNLHPSASQYAQWVDAICIGVEEMIINEYSF